MKLNCWEFKKCGRQPGGQKVFELGECAAATESRLDGMHGGKNGGRSCWVIRGTLCEGKVQGTFSSKMGSCVTCEFFKMVNQEEQGQLTKSSELLARLRPSAQVVG